MVKGFTRGQRLWGPALVGLALLSAPLSASAQQLTVDGNRALGLAEHLLQKGQPDAAEAILKTLAGADGAKVDTLKIDYLAGLIAAGRGEHERAVSLYGHILDYDPDLHGVRFQLGRCLYALERDREAARAFAQLGRSELPGPLARDVHQFLARIDDRRLVDFSASAALIPDSNINTATDEATQIIGGVEQRLNDDGALRQSGVGLSSSVRMRLRPKLGFGWRSDSAVYARLTDQSAEEFDFLTYGTDLGAARYFGRTRLGAYILASRQNFAGAPYAESYGTRVTFSRPVGKAFRVSGAISGETADYKLNDSLDGVTGRGVLSLSARLGRTSSAGVSFILARHDAASPTQSYHRYGTAFSYMRRLPWKTNLRIAPSFLWRQADEASAAFGAIREDQTVSLSLSMTKRDIQFRGFSPRVTYTGTINDSTIDLYDYDRHRVDLGFTQEF